MDKMVIASKLMRGMISKLMSKIIREKVGYKINIQINDPINVTIDEGGKAHIHISIDADMDTSEFMKFNKFLD